MGSVRVVTDGGADLPGELVERLGIEVVQGPVRFGPDRWEGTPEAFWGEVRSGPRMPATSPPTAEMLRAVFEGGDPVCAVHVSAELSRTEPNAREAAAQLASPVHVVDSRSLSIGTGLVAMVLAQAARAGLGLGELAALADVLVERTHVHAVIEDVEYLMRGGRAGLVGTGARRGVREVIAVRGHAIPLERSRDHRRAIEKLFGHISRNHMGHGNDQWAVGHGDAADIDTFVARGAEVFGRPPTFVVLLGPSVGTHAGPGALVVGLVAAA